MIQSDNLVHRFTRRAFLAALLPLLLTQASSATLPAGKEWVIPIYSKSEALPVARISIHDFHQEFQRRGFFRIGLLPMWVAEGVRIEILASNQVDHVLKTLRDWHPPRTETRAVEWRKVSIILGSQKQPLLQAGLLRSLPGGTFQFSEGVHLWTCNTTSVWQEARWAPVGNQLGCLELQNGTSIPIPIPTAAFSPSSTSP